MELDEIFNDIHLFISSNQSLVIFLCIALFLILLLKLYVDS